MARSQEFKTIYNKKMAPKREEPFQITKVLSSLIYSLSLPAMWRIHNVFHAFLLTPYVENEIHGPNYARPPAHFMLLDNTFENCIIIIWGDVFWISSKMQSGKIYILHIDIIKLSA